MTKKNCAAALLLTVLLSISPPPVFAALTPYTPEQRTADQLQKLKEAQNAAADSSSTFVKLAPHPSTASPASAGSPSAAVSSTARQNKTENEKHKGNGNDRFAALLTPERWQAACALYAGRRDAPQSRRSALMILGADQEHKYAAIIVLGTPRTLHINLNGIDLKTRFQGSSELKCGAERAGEIRLYDLSSLKASGAVLTVKADSVTASAVL